MITVRKVDSAPLVILPCVLLHWRAREFLAVWGFWGVEVKWGTRR